MRIPAILLLWCVGAPYAASSQTVQCAPDSPERRGEPGCSIVAIRPLAIAGASRVYWHVDGFDSLGDARAAAGPLDLVLSAHGRAWVVRVERDTVAHRASSHRAWVGPITLVPARSYMMQIMSAYFLPGQRTPVHTHSGPEAWYVVAGEQCLETPTTVIRASAGQGAVVADGDTMRLVATGAAPRRALVLILYDAQQTPTHIIDPGPALKACV
jgi:quercetin dioxygenase-like cupin family protein